MKSIIMNKMMIACLAIGVAFVSSSIALADGHTSATGVEYVKKDQINGGEPIKLEYWEWSGQRAKYQEAWAKNYMEMYPNVEIEVVLQPWDTYWPSLITNVPAGKGPVMWHMHGSKMTEFCEGNLMDPIPATAADPDYLNKHWIGFAEGAMSCSGTGSIHTIPMGAMMPLLFIDTDAWTEAGLSDSDIPKTWDDLRDVAKKLTQRDSRGRITVAGLSLDPQEWIPNAVYQQGRFLFNKDGTKANVNNDEYRAALQFISDIVHIDKVVDQEILIERHNAMAGGKTEMYAGFSWIAGLLRNNAPDLNWIAVPIPTPDGSNQPAYGNMRFAVEAVINPNASKAEKAVAWDFWHFNYSNNDVVRDDLAIFNGFLPPYDALLNDAKILADPLASVMAPLGEFGLINDLPQVVRAEMQELATAVVLDPSDLDGKLVSSQKVQNDLLSKRSDWNIIERNYGNSAKMIQD